MSRRQNKPTDQTLDGQDPGSTGANRKEPPTWAPADTVAGTLPSQGGDAVRLTVLDEQFELVRLLGEGSMGQVFLARDLELGRHVAVKVIKTSGSKVKRYLELLRRDAMATARLQHPGIVTIYQLGTWDDRPFIVLELLAGEALDTRLERVQRLETEEALHIGIQIADALRYAHAEGVIHRDLKPANIFITHAGRAVVLDFGVALLDVDHTNVEKAVEAASPELRARIGQAPVFCGTPLYMSPEQWLREDQDERTDIWSLGVMLFELVTGKAPLAPMEAVGDAPIPTLLQVDESLPPELSQLIASMMARDRADRPENAGQVFAALKEIRARLRRQNNEAKAAPYRYLASFEERDARWFFGRDAEIGRLTQHVLQHAVTVVTGPSGAGKSSLVKAGLIPRWRRRFRNTEAITLRPGTAPVDRLVNCLTLSGRSPASVHALRQKLLEEKTRLLVVVDQLEELVSRANADESRALLSLLLLLADDPSSPIRVVCTLREDHLSRLPAPDPFQDALSDGLFLVRPPDDAALRDALVSPADMLDFEVEEAVAEEVLQWVGQASAPLPLLQFIASRLWESRDAEDRIIRKSALDEMGGAAGLLAGHADDLLRTLPARVRPLAPDILCSLVSSSGTRIPVSLPELVERHGKEAEALVEKLASGRLLSISPGDDERTVELAHESLLVHWDTLRRWLDDEAATRRFQEELGQAARQWLARDRSPQLLWPSELLNEARIRRDALQNTLTRDERAFLNRSRRQARRKRRLVWASVAALLIVLIGFSLFAAVNWQKAESAREQAVVAREQALAAGEQADEARQDAEQRSLVARARLAEQEGHFGEALALTRAAVSLDPESEVLRDSMARLLATGSIPRVVELPEPARDLMPLPNQEILALGGERAWIIAPPGQVRQELTPDGELSCRLASGATRCAGLSGQRLVLGHADGSISGWDLDEASQRWSTSVGSSPIADLVLDDGRVWAVSRSGELAVLSAQNGKALGRIRLDFAAEGIAVDGGRAAVGGSGGEVAILSMKPDAGGVSVSLYDQPHLHAIRQLAFTEGQLVTASWDEQAMILDPDLLTTRHWLAGHTQVIYALAVDEKRRLVLTGSSDQTARLWSLDSGELLQVFAGHTRAVADVAFTSDGRVVTASSDGTTRIWSPTTGVVETTLSQHDGFVLSVLALDGGSIVTSGEDGRLRIWSPDSVPRGRPVSVHNMDVYSVSWSADGKRLATGSKDGLARVIDVGSGKSVRGLRHPSQVFHVALSPDGREVITASMDGSVRRFSAADGGLLGQVGDGARGTASWTVREGPLVAIADDVGTRLWNLDTEQVLNLESSGTPHQAMFTSEGLVVVTADGRLRVFSRDGTEVTPPALAEVTQEPRPFRRGALRSAIALIPQENAVAVLEEGAMAVYSLDGELQKRVVLPSDIVAGASAGNRSLRPWRWLAVSPGGKQLAVGNDVAWMAQDDGVPVAAPPSELGVPTAISFSSDGKELAAGWRDGVVRVYPTSRSPSPPSRVVLSSHQDRIRDLEYSPDGAFLATASVDDTVRVWPARMLQNPPLDPADATNLRVCRETGETTLDEGSSPWSCSRSAEP